MPLLLNLLIRQLRLIIPPTLLRRQLRREIPRRNTIDADIGLFELRAHEFGEVHGGALSGVVGELYDFGVSIPS